MIEIVQTGPLNTIQDLGRPGYRDIGVSASGAMDPLAVRIGNILLGNPEVLPPSKCRPFRSSFVLPSTRILSSLARKAGHASPDVHCCHGAHIAQPRAMSWSSSSPVVWHVPTSWWPVGSTCLSSWDRAVPRCAAGLGGNCGRPLATGDTLSIVAADEALPLPKGGISVIEPEVALRQSLSRGHRWRAFGSCHRRRRARALRRRRRPVLEPGLADLLTERPDGLSAVRRTDQAGCACRNALAWGDSWRGSGSTGR